MHVPGFGHGIKTQPRNISKTPDSADLCMLAADMMSQAFGFGDKRWISYHCARHRNDLLVCNGASSAELFIASRDIGRQEAKCRRTSLDELSCSCRICTGG